MVSLKEIEASLKRAQLIKTLNAHNEKRKQDMSDLVRSSMGRATKSTKSTQTPARNAKDTYIRFGGVRTAVNDMRGDPEPANPRLYKLAKFLRRKLVKK